MNLSVLIPTAGRHELENCLLSLRPQLRPWDECFVIGDTADGPLPWTEHLVASYGAPFRYAEHDGGSHSWGHAQLDAGIPLATCQYLAFIDDDDVYVPGALDVIRNAIQAKPDSPHLFRFLNYHGFLCWVERGLFEEGYIGGHCLIARNMPGKIGSWGSRYEGDWDYVSSTVALQGGPAAIEWHDDVIALARPSQDVIVEIRRLAGAPLAVAA